jgi:hypothetical protein
VANFAALLFFPGGNPERCKLKTTPNIMTSLSTQMSPVWQCWLRGVAKAGSTFFTGDKTKGFSAFVAPLLLGGASHNQILIMTDM